MKLIRALIFSFILTITFSTSLMSSGISKYSFSKENIAQNIPYADSYRYERVFEYSVWWIYVYNSDNVLIDRYLEDID